METIEILFLLIGVFLILRLMMILASSDKNLNINGKQAILWSSISIIMLVLFKIGIIIS